MIELWRIDTSNADVRLVNDYCVAVYDPATALQYYRRSVSRLRRTDDDNWDMLRMFPSPLPEDQTH